MANFKVRLHRWRDQNHESQRLQQSCQAASTVAELEFTIRHFDAISKALSQVSAINPDGALNDEKLRSRFRSKSHKANRMAKSILEQQEEQKLAPHTLYVSFQNFLSFKERGLTPCKLNVAFVFAITFGSLQIAFLDLELAFASIPVDLCNRRLSRASS